ncbi:MAG TPA: protoporphyrinogen oxidase [Gemmatimonadales bacterium]|nr:protoporphyrinogen oxidase [Gemmatimonadales bacterium]
MAAVAVVGAGIAGLTAAYRLKQGGVRVVVYESGDRPGGMIRTERRDGYLADLGPNSMAAPNPATASLLADLDLAGKLLPASPEARHRYVVRRGKLLALPASPPELLTTRLLSNAAKLAVFGEPLVDAGDGPVEESIAGFVRRRFNQEILDYVANPLVAGIFAGDPEQLSMRHALPRLYALEQSHGSLIKAMIQRSRGRRAGDEAADEGAVMSFRDGLQELSDALVRVLGPAVRLRAAVTQVRRGPKGWTVGAAFQANELYDAVVLTPPAHCADELDLGFEGAERLKTVASIPHPPVAVLALGFRREEVSHPLDGFGFLVPEVERKHVLGALFSSTLFPGRAPEGHVLITVFVGGVRNPDLANADLATLTARVQDDLRTLVGARGEPTFRAWHLWPKAIPQYTLSHGRYKEIMDDVERRNVGLGLAGSFRDGVALGDVIAGADQAASRLLPQLGGAAAAPP